MSFEKLLARPADMPHYGLMTTCTCPACQTSTRPNDARMCPDRGSAYRYVRACYAWRVAMAMTDGRPECPTCGTPITPDSVECDKAVPDNGYRPGTIVAVCAGKYGCNQSRARLQTTGADWSRVADYVADVANASARVAVPTVSEARAWWQSRETVGTARVSRYA